MQPSLLISCLRMTSSASPALVLRVLRGKVGSHTVQLRPLKYSKKRKGSNFYIESWRGSQRISLATDFGLKTSLLATDDADDSAGDGGDVRLGVFSWTHCSTATAKFFSCTDITFARKGWLNRGHHCTITKRVRHTQRVTRC